jgi:hypothetical protein
MYRSDRVHYTLTFLCSLKLVRPQMLSHSIKSPVCSQDMFLDFYANRLSLLRLTSDSR